MKKRCIVVPAIKKNAVIPDQLVKKLAGITLIERAINTARACEAGRDIIVLTDSEEIGLICERLGVRHVRDRELRFRSLDIVAEMRVLLRALAGEYENCVILRASCPLLTWVDIEDAWRKYLESGADGLVTVKNVRQRVWNIGDGRNVLNALEDGEKEYLVESRALIILKLANFADNAEKRPQRIIPYFLDERAIEIQNYQDWWICEHLLMRRHVVFAVAGYPAIGMGHVYRALMLAHEISNHKITFVCTSQSELAVESVASRDYRVVRQGEDPLAQTVLAQRPDLVVNDFLNTSVEYMQALGDIPKVNFEDEGPGAKYADLVINALYGENEGSEKLLAGPDYFCLRDEFVNAARNPLRGEVKTLLITFGGTDQHDCTRRVLDIVEPICRERGIAIRIVAGPGYAHREAMEKHLAELGNPLVEFAWATNIMSRRMEGADLAICSAGRTVYELAHMRVPAIVLATHEREARHTFARARNGFAFAGIMDKIPDSRIRNLFLAMLGQERRARYWERQDRLDFGGNKARVVGLIENLLEKD